VPTITLHRIANADLSDNSVQTILEDSPSAEVPILKAVRSRLFIFRDQPEMPEWAEYIAAIATRRLDIPNREAVGAILLVRPNVRHRIIYAVTWGTGRFHLRSDRLERDWGLRCALNLMSGDKAGDRGWDPARVRALRSKRVSQNTFISEIQSSRKTTIDLFPFEADIDQLRRVTGAPIDSTRFGRTISGGVSIHIKRPDFVPNLLPLCRDIERVHNSTDYRRHFEWIDNVSPVTDQAKNTQVYDRIVAALQGNQLRNLNLSPPNVVKWDDVSRFAFQWGRVLEEIDEPSIESFRQFLVTHNFIETLSAPALREGPKVHALDDSRAKIQSWSVNRCLSGEFTIGGDAYVLDEGALLNVARDYLRKLNRFTNTIDNPRQTFPTVEQTEEEDSYNSRLSQRLHHAILLDRKTVRRHQGTSIEICDVATRDRQLIHVKRGTSSSSLSHLFAQGVVSGELLHMDSNFRREVSRLLSGRANREVTGSGSARMQDFAWLYDDNFEPHSCEVVYVIMTKKPRNINRDELPFFSKINLRMRCNELRRMGYRYSLALVHL
jgi:uncharacterized protein (TIGR04141 family)